MGQSVEALEKPNLQSLVLRIHTEEGKSQLLQMVLSPPCACANQ